VIIGGNNKAKFAYPFHASSINTSILALPQKLYHRTISTLPCKLYHRTISLFLANYTIKRKSLDGSMVEFLRKS
jgi:hypothetical protein